MVPLSPGAAVDIETRLYAQKLAQNTGRSFVVDYKPGARTTIGLGHVGEGRARRPHARRDHGLGHDRQARVPRSSRSTPTPASPW